MKHVLDVNVLIAAIWTGHVHHEKVIKWIAGKEVVICPVAELGFIRISSHKKFYGLPMQDVRKGLRQIHRGAQSGTNSRRPSCSGQPIHNL